MTVGPYPPHRGG